MWFQKHLGNSSAPAWTRPVHLAEGLAWFSQSAAGASGIFLFCLFVCSLFAGGYSNNDFTTLPMQHIASSYLQKLSSKFKNQYKDASGKLESVLFLRFSPWKELNSGQGRCAAGARWKESTGCLSLIVPSEWELLFQWKYCINTTPQREQNCAVKSQKSQSLDLPRRPERLRAKEHKEPPLRTSAWVWEGTFHGSFIAFLEAYQNHLATHTLLCSPSKHCTRSAHLPSSSERSGRGKMS